MTLAVVVTGASTSVSLFERVRCASRSAVTAGAPAVITGMGYERGGMSSETGRGPLAAPGRRRPRHPIWNKHVRPWLGRRARGADERLTDRLGGPASRTVIILLGMVLGLGAADTSSLGAIAAQLQPALGIGTAEIGLLVTASALVGALAAIPFGLLVDKTRRVDVLAVSVLCLSMAGGGERLLHLVHHAAAHPLAAWGSDGHGDAAVASLTVDCLPAGERRRAPTATSSVERGGRRRMASGCGGRVRLGGAGLACGVHRAGGPERCCSR